MDSPATWAPMLNTLRGDPDIRRHYQFWFYSYPSGYPYPYSAAILRRELDAAEKRYPPRKPMVLIGHSMGGMISRLMITDSADTLWLKTFGKPPEQVPLSANSREMLTESLIFRHRPEVGRVIFIAAPHKGSDLARNWLGRIGSSLVKAPTTLTSIGKEALSLVTLDVGAMKLRRIPNSVDTLSPNNRFVKDVSAIPITPGIPYHTICGPTRRARRRAEVERRRRAVLEFAPRRCAERAGRAVEPQRASKSAGHRGGAAHSQTTHLEAATGGKPVAECPPHPIWNSASSAGSSARRRG